MRKRPPKPVPVHNLKVTRAGKVKKRSILWRWRRAWYVCGLAVVLGLAGLVYVLGQIELPRDPRFEDAQAQTSYVCADNVQVNCNAANAMAQLHGTEDRELVSYEQIPPILREAVLSAEDKDFFKHGGVDPLGIARAAAYDIRGNSASRQGGSTITQQYVKKTYLSSEQTVTRKIKEAVMAIKLEQEISKEEILTRYLNTVYFGRGAYGVQAASRAWFDHDVESVDAGEAAFLAGLLRNPNGADPYRGDKLLKEAERRRRVVLANMVKEGYVTQAEMNQLVKVPMDPADPSVAPEDRFIVAPPVPSTLGENVKGAQWGSEYFAEYVRQWLLKEFGEEQVYGGGLKVYTTIDLNMQRAAYDAVTSTLNRQGDPSGSIVAVDDKGQVKAMMGGTDFKNNELNLATGRDGGGLGRQPGSTFKTFALTEAVKEGYSIRSVMPAPGKIEITDPVCLNGEKMWKVRGGPGATASLVSATKNSMNTVFAQLMVRLGPDAVAKTAVDMGVKSLEGQDPRCAWVLGSGEVSVLDMAAGYSTLANEGIAKSPIVVTRVEFPDGTVKRYEPEQHRVLTSEQAGRVTFALQQVIDGGTGKQANIGKPAAGKTGTTQRNVDGWFVGYTPKLTAAVWMGHPEGLIPMTSVHGMRVQGGTFPAMMWRKFMLAATADFDTGEFPELDAEVLNEGKLLDPRLGKSIAIAPGAGQAPATTRPTATTAPTGSTTPDSTPSSSSPASTAPPATSPPNTKPPATTPPATVAGAGPAG